MDCYIEKAVSKLRWGPLGQHIATFVAALTETGYARESVQKQLRLLSQLGRWMQRTRRAVTDLDQINSQVFLAAYGRRRRLKRGDRATLRHLIEHLQDQGVITVRIAVPENEQPFTKLERRYENHLLKERGLAAVTVRGYIRLVHQFLLRCCGERPLALKKLKAWEVSNFIVQYTGCKSPTSSQSMVKALRSFFRFLTQEGETQIDLATCIPSVPCRKQARLPKYISDNEVEKLLAACDRSTPVGRRDYAVLLLLARLGLRAGEVAGLHLEDVDWRSGEIRVLGKGVRDRLPLIAEVGEALATYLRNRPCSSSRNVFLCINAPCRHFRSSTVSKVVRRALSRAGLKPPHTGAHLLRHSLATNLLRKGASMAEIAELLRHRSSGTTEIYAKVDSLSLRTLAQPWPTMRGGR
jgi:site-specific recombinase XerD